MASNLEKNKVTRHSQMGIFDVGLKQDLINRLISECKDKKKLFNELFEKEKIINLNNDMGDTVFFLYAIVNI
ncbi:13422_t:CDS:2 [Cetraspora pellucida]|uniref:13422_t:CDS:1 n=1 Tax=Cetraspora pellucida TaxID=1433469 RepID=A0A9N9AEQ9_9GLOM|nr:13422_t:CDS:2 [Cetraspora pellucida]